MSNDKPTGDIGRVKHAFHLWRTEKRGVDWDIMHIVPDVINALEQKRDEYQALADHYPKVVEALGELVGHIPVWMSPPYSSRGDGIRDTLTDARELLAADTTLCTECGEACIGCCEIGINAEDATPEEADNDTD